MKAKMTVESYLSAHCGLHGIDKPIHRLKVTGALKTPPNTSACHVFVSKAPKLQPSSSTFPVLERLQSLNSNVVNTLATACHLVLDDRGGYQIKKQTPRTINWQEVQIRRVACLLSHFTSHGFISCAIKAKYAERAVENKSSEKICQYFGLPGVLRF